MFTFHTNLTRSSSTPIQFSCAKMFLPLYKTLKSNHSSGTTRCYSFCGKRSQLKKRPAKWSLGFVFWCWLVVFFWLKSVKVQTCFATVVTCAMDTGTDWGRSLSQPMMPHGVEPISMLGLAATELTSKKSHVVQEDEMPRNWRNFFHTEEDSKLLFGV